MSESIKIGRDEEMSPPRHLVGNWPYVINLANSIIGVSVLALPFCFKECGIVLGFLLLMGNAWLTQLTCNLLMNAAFSTKKRSYEYLAFHIFGRAGKLIVELSIIGLLIGTCIAFYIIIGDIGPAVISKITGLENTPNLRTVLLIFLTLTIIFPLAMLHSLDSLSNISAISIMFYSIFVVEVVIVAFPNVWSGIWMTKIVIWNTEGIFKCLPIFALSYSCQTQLFIMSDSLPEPSLHRVNKIVQSAIVMCSIIYVSVGCFGYIAFCDDYISGDILMNFRPTIISEMIKIGFVMSTLISFPLVIFPCRASLFTLLFLKKSVHDNFGGGVYIPPYYFKLLTVSVICVTLIIGILVPNVEFMLAITGATMGSLICYIFPAILFITALNVDSGNNKSFAQLVLLIGVTILLASTYVTLTGQEKVVRHDSMVKVGQPIVHNEDNLKIIDANGMKENEKDLPTDKSRPKHGEDVIIEENANLIFTSTVLSLMKKSNEEINVIREMEKREMNERKENDEKKKKEEIVVEDKEVGKRKEPPNPHAPFDEVVVNKKELSQKENLSFNNVNNGNDLRKIERTLEPAQKQELHELTRNKEEKERSLKNILEKNNETKENDKTVRVDFNEEGKVKEDNRNKEYKEGRLTEKKNKKPLIVMNFNKSIESEKYLNHSIVSMESRSKDVHEDAKVILQELKKQQQEQRKLLDEHRQIIDEMKRHQKEVHDKEPVDVVQDERKPVNVVKEPVDVERKLAIVTKEPMPVVKEPAKEHLMNAIIDEKKQKENLN